MRRFHLRDAFAVLALAFLLFASCGGEPKSHRLETGPLESKVLGKQMPFSLLMPPGGAPGDAASLHVVYQLHGYGGGHTALDDEGLSDGLLVAQERGRIPRVFIALPEGERGFYINWHDGSLRYEDYIIGEAIPAIEKALGLELSRARRHIMGVSMGGYGALVVGLKHAEMFESIASLSGSLFDEEKAIELANKRFLDWAIDIRRMLGDGTDREFLERNNPYSLIRALAPEARPRLFVGVGREEPSALRKASTQFHAFLDGEGVAHEWVEFAGGHDWESWAPVIEKAIVHAAKPVRRQEALETFGSYQMGDDQARSSMICGESQIVGR